jgi:hypothetical protein
MLVSGMEAETVSEAQRTCRRGAQRVALLPNSFNLILFGGDRVGVDFVPLKPGHS